MLKNDHKLGLLALIAMCVGSMVGAGLFDLPQNIACKAGVVSALLGWLVTFFGMLALATVFQNLSMRCPDLDGGIYAYAKAALGDYVGFNSAWGYWISAWIGNSACLIMQCAALSFFFPLFNAGTSWLALVVNSCMIWGVTYLCLCGIRSASAINTAITIFKVVPIIAFVIITALAFQSDIFVYNIKYASPLGSLTSQIKNMMLVAVWVFIGIEGATVFSARAKNRRDIGKATIFSFLIMACLLFAIFIKHFLLAFFCG